MAVMTTENSGLTLGVSPLVKVKLSAQVNVRENGILRVAKVGEIVSISKFDAYELIGLNRADLATEDEPKEEEPKKKGKKND